MPTATVDGNELHYLQRGEGEPLLLVMGMSGTHLAWGDPFLDLLDGFALTAYDHRGVGRSSRFDQPFTIARLADDAAGLLDVLGIESAHVVGVSMGGMVAQQIALRHPERVRALVVGCSYAGGPDGALTSPPVVQRLGEAYGSGDRERALRTFWETNVSAGFRARGDGEYQRWRAMATSLPVPLAVVRRQAQAIGGHDTSERLGDVEAPTLLIHGTEDEILPVSNSRAMVERIPGARLEELEGVGHLFWWEQPERSAELIREHARAAAAAR